MKPFIASHLKDMNRKLVYQLISSVEEISKAEISRLTGISSPTVIKIVNFFIENGFLEEAGQGEAAKRSTAGSAAIGRKPHMLRFKPDAAYSIGVEFEGELLTVGLVDLSGNIKLSRQVSMPHDLLGLIDQQLYDYIRQIIEEAAIDKEHIWGVGLGIPGVVDPANAIVKLAPLVGIADELVIADRIDSLGQKLNLPVYIENDVNAAARGEFLMRRLSSVDDLIFISVGTGVGAGIILNGELHSGKHFNAGEIGYMVFDKGYSSSKASGGWLETHIDGKDRLVSNLAMSIANIAAFIDTDLFVLGGKTIEAYGKSLLEQIEQSISKICSFPLKLELQSCISPGVVGAAALATKNKLDQLLID